MNADLETRLRRVERTNRWLTIGFVLAVGSAVAMGSARQNTAKTLRADRVIATEFEIVGADGVSLGTLGVVGETPRLSLKGRTGKIQAVVSVLDNGAASVMVCDESQKAKVTLSSGGDSGTERAMSRRSSIRLKDQNGAERLIFQADAMFNETINGTDSKGKEVISLPK
jgi:hypothetical protein